MLDKLIHVNSVGEILKIGSGIFLNYSDLRDYGTEEKTLPFIIFDNPEVKDKFFEHFEKDILSGNDGHFEINGYKCYGRITKIKNSNYLIDDRYIEKNVTFNATTRWIKEISKLFKSVDARNGKIRKKEYTYSYPFVYSSVKGSGIIENNSHYKTDGIIKFYGPCINPFVKIDKSIYQVNVSLSKDERVSINIKERTIKKVDIVGNETNAFVYRNKNFNVFEKLPPGTSIVSWDPSYSVEIIIIDERGEPKWQ